MIVIGTGIGGMYDIARYTLYRWVPDGARYLDEQVLEETVSGAPFVRVIDTPYPGGAHICVYDQDGNDRTLMWCAHAGDVWGTCHERNFLHRRTLLSSNRGPAEKAAAKKALRSGRFGRR